MSRPSYDKGPVLLEWVRFNAAINVQDVTGSLIPIVEYLRADREWHIELVPGRLCRIWNARRLKDGHVCKVTTVGPENLASWHAKDDCIEPDAKNLTAA